MILAECKQLPKFPFKKVRARCVNDVENLYLVISGTVKKCQYINDFSLLPCLKPATLLKTTHRHRFFLVNCVKFLASNFIKNETAAQLFSCESLDIFQLAASLKTNPTEFPFFSEFCKIFKNNYVVDHLLMAASNA